VENQTLRNLIKVAYNVQDFQLLGGPAWINSERYDIDARAQGNPPLADVAGAMIQTLLEDRFRLAIHSEKKELPCTYSLPPRAALRFGQPDWGVAPLMA
jgi:uncharacterized protein (TIGR03435 family)